MFTMNYLNRLLLLSLTTLPLLTGQEIQPVEPATVSHLNRSVVRTITIGNDVYAIGEAQSKPFRVLLTSGVTQAFGIARGRLAFRVDDDLFLLNLSTGRRTQVPVGAPVVNATWSPNGDALAVALKTDTGVSLKVIPLDESPRTLLYASAVVPDVIRWIPDGTIVFAAEEAPEETMLLTRAVEGTVSAKRIRRQSLPVLAVATDDDLRSNEPERSIERRWNDNRKIPLAITDTGVWTHSGDTGEIEFRQATHDGGSLQEGSIAKLLANDVRAATGIPAYGTLLGDYDGVSVYSNGTASFVSNESNYIGQTYIGMKWQCVELIRRYFFSKFGIDLAAKFTGDAWEWWNGAATMNLDRFANGGSTPPEPGDILVSTGSTGNVGHVALVRSRNATSICTANQNLSNTAEQLNRCLTLTINAGQYTVAGFSSSYPTTGWLRRKTTTTTVKGELTSPTPNSTLGGTTQTFGWTTGQNISQYFLYVGTSTGNNDIYGASQGTNRAATVGNLPTDGRTLYVRLWSFGNGSWLFADYQYRAASVSQGSGVKAEMTSPANGSTFTGATQAFAWSTGQNVTQYFLYVGTTTGANDVYGASQGTNRTATVGNLPTDGRTLYVRLWSMVNGSWVFADYQYRAGLVSQVSGAKAEITSPAPGSTLTGATQTFVWGTGQNVAQYFLYVGTGIGANNLYATSTGTSRFATVSGLPTDGRTLYVRLWSFINGSWQWADYQYRAATR